MVPLSLSEMVAENAALFTDWGRDHAVPAGHGGFTQVEEEPRDRSLALTLPFSLLLVWMHSQDERLWGHGQGFPIPH